MLFHSNHFGGWVEVPHGILNFCIFLITNKLIYLFMFAGYLAILFCEVGIQVFCPFSMFLICRCSFYILYLGSPTMACRPYPDCHLCLWSVTGTQPRSSVFVYGFHHTVAKWVTVTDSLACKAQNTIWPLLRNTSPSTLKCAVMCMNCKYLLPLCGLPIWFLNGSFW